jgi:hypothetical protein
MRKIVSSHNMRRRDFFSTLTQATIDVLGQNAFHGTLQETPYTFVPSNLKDKPTLVVVDGLRLREKLYLDNFNVIFMDKWPQTNDVIFWRKLLLRHDLTDQVFILCKFMPQSAPSFIKRIVCLNSGSASMASVITRRLPTMVMVDELRAGTLPKTATWAAGSDVFVGTANGLNISGSSAHKRFMEFLKI